MSHRTVSVGMRVKIIRDLKADYGHYFGKCGTLVAGGAKYRGVPRFLFRLDPNPPYIGGGDIYVYEMDFGVVK